MNKKMLALVAAASVMAAVPATAQIRVSSSGMTENFDRMSPRSGLNNQDRKFMVEACHINMAEVMLGKLAQQRGGTWGREYGQDMVREHGTALEELKLIARNRNMSLPIRPDKKHMQLYNRLAMLSGEAFDREYRRAMVAGHGEAAMKFATEIKRGHDSSVRNYAVTMLPGVKMHQKLAAQRDTITG